MVGGVTIVSFVALLYVIELFDSLSNHRLDDNGIRPLETDGLTGIIFAPLLHANWDHLIANTVPALILGFLMTLAGHVAVHLRHRDHLDPRRLRHLADRQYRRALPLRRRELRDQPHRRVRADLRLADVPDRVRVLHPQVWEIVVGVVVLFVYGGVLLGVLPGTPGVSWQGHLCGAIAGVIAAYLLSGPERKAREARKRGLRSLPTTFRRRDLAVWRPSGSSIPASADSPSRGRSSTSCPTRTSSTSATPPTARTVR